MRAAHDCCGPIAVASVLGCTREEAWARLSKLEPRKRGWINASSVGHVLGRKVVRLHKRTTLAQWLRSDGRDAVILVARHFVHVKDGEVVTRLRIPMRGRVHSFILLNSPQQGDLF